MAEVNSSCPHCGATFRVSSDLLGKKLRCKRCGEAFRFAEEAREEEFEEESGEKGEPIEATGGLLLTDRAKRAAKPLISRNERMLYASTPSALLLFKWLLAANFLPLLWLVSIGIASAAAPRGMSLPGMGVAAVIVLLVAGLISLALYLNWAKTVYVLTERQAITRSGILALRVTRVPLRRIQQVSYAGGMIERLFGLGTIRIITGGFWGINWRSVAHSEVVVKLVAELINRSYASE